MMDYRSSGFIFTNLVDFDSRLWTSQRRCRLCCKSPAIRRAARGHSAPRFARRDLLVVTADHGNDPSTPSTDHSREYVPILLTGASVRAGVDIGTRGTFADLGQTLAENFGIEPTGARDELSRADSGGGHCRASVKRWNSANARCSRPRPPESADSRGRLRPEPEDDVRPAFQHDRDRIIHSKAFRRLKHKTQVFFAPAGDHYRTRLTHTLEVSQIAQDHRESAAAA